MRVNYLCRSIVCGDYYHICSFGSHSFGSHCSVGSHCSTDISSLHKEQESEGYSVSSDIDLELVGCLTSSSRMYLLYHRAMVSSANRADFQFDAVKQI